MAIPKQSPEAQSRSFEDARLETLECGFLLACYQTLLLAMQDRRLQYRHRAVLAVLIQCMNSQSGMTWIGRNKIADNLGLAVETVSNTLRELSLFGYILAENRRTPETSNRSLRHYTLAGLSKDEIRAKIADAIAVIKASGPRALKPEATTKATARSDFESHRPQGLSEAKSPPTVDESHRRQWTVTNKKKLVSEVSVANQSSQASEQALFVVDEVKAKRKGHPTGKRHWEWLGQDEKRELLERCQQYAEERGWPPKFLAQRLDAFVLYQKDRKIPSADWWAALELWLGNPNYQPRANRSTGRFSPASLLDDIDEDGGWR